MHLVLAAGLGVAVVGLGRLLAKADVLSRFNRQRAAVSQQPASDHREPLTKVVARCEARWFLEDLKSALAGDEGAMERVGDMLLAGFGVRQDGEEALKWLQQAWAIQNYRELPSGVADAGTSCIPCLASSGMAEDSPHDMSELSDGCRGMPTGGLARLPAGLCSLISGKGHFGLAAGAASSALRGVVGSERRAGTTASSQALPSQHRFKLCTQSAYDHLGFEGFSSEGEGAADMQSGSRGKRHLRHDTARECVQQAESCCGDSEPDLESSNDGEAVVKQPFSARSVGNTGGRPFGDSTGHYYSSRLHRSYSADGQRGWL